MNPHLPPHPQPIGSNPLRTALRPDAPRTFCQDRFEYLDKLGEGSYGKVYKVFDRHKKKVMALKKVKFHGDKYQGIPQSSLRELAILKEVNHPNVIRLEDIIGATDGSHELFLVFEMADLDLRKFLHAQGYRVPPEKVRKLMYELVVGVDYLHRNRILHRDLKPENVLVSKTGEHPKLADFGLSRTVHMPLRPYSREILSLWYRSPELCMGYKHYSLGVDVWALGCIFFELVTGKPLFKAKSDSEMILAIFELFGTPRGDKWDWVKKIGGFNVNLPVFPGTGLKALVKEQVSADGLELMGLMLELDPLKRIPCAEALLHPFFKGLGQTQPEDMY